MLIYGCPLNGNDMLINGIKLSKYWLDWFFASLHSWFIYHLQIYQEEYWFDSGMRGFISGALRYLGTFREISYMVNLLFISCIHSCIYTLPEFCSWFPPEMNMYIYISLHHHKSWGRDQTKRKNIFHVRQHSFIFFWPKKIDRFAEINGWSCCLKQLLS